MQQQSFRILIRICLFLSSTYSRLKSWARARSIFCCYCADFFFFWDFRSIFEAVAHSKEIGMKKKITTFFHSLLLEAQMRTSPLPPYLPPPLFVIFKGFIIYCYDCISSPSISTNSVAITKCIQYTPLCIFKDPSSIYHHQKFSPKMLWNAHSVCMSYNQQFQREWHL